MRHASLIILGSGPAGCTAAIYAARANIKPILITGMVPGGQLTTTTEIDNWPGESPGLTGSALMDRMINHVKRFDVEIVYDVIDQVDVKNSPFTLQSHQEQYSCDALIIATGAKAKYLGLPSEEKFKGKGVSACATCDGPFYRNKKVAVVGGGNTAITEAIYLASIAAEVTVIHRKNSFNAEPVMIDRMMEIAKQGNVHIEWNSQLLEVLGDESEVNAMKIKNNQTGVTKKKLVDGIFIAIGHEPNTSLFTGQLVMDHGYIVTQSGRMGNVTATNVPGVFATGDVTDHVYRQAIVSAGSGCMAALDAQRYLTSFNH